jgi:hypothetical protein
MGWGIRRFAIWAIIIGAIALIAGCSGGGFFAVRDAWRQEAEVQCFESGAVREGAGIVRISPIRGPGVCGAEYPLKVSSLGEATPMAYADDLRPPGTVPNGSSVPRWPILNGREVPPQGNQNQPISLDPPGTAERPRGAPDDYDFRRPYGAGTPQQPAYRATPAAPPIPERGTEAAGTRHGRGLEPSPSVALSPAPAATALATPVAVSPPATLACPIVSELDRWISNSVQPAAMRWFGTPVAEIKQISAYSCRGMNGNPRARISEHAFGNALDIAAFTLADGRTITVKAGWNGLPEEQGFLRDIQAAACDQFTTVLAPGSNAYHYDHIHVDLMRRSSRHRACNPEAVSGEDVAARAQARYAARYGEPTGSLPKRLLSRPPRRLSQTNEPLPDRALPLAQPGEDGED